MSITFEVQVGDVTQVASDLVVLKYAQTFYGPDGAIAHALANRGICALTELQPHPGAVCMVETRGVVAPARAMFIGTPTLKHFRYEEMRQFGVLAMRELATSRLPVRTITTTVHGAGYGLDISESLTALVHGFREGAKGHLKSPARLIFIERDPRRAGTLETALRELSLVEQAPVSPNQPATSRRAGESSVRLTVFVAMPFSIDFEDVYEFGIYGAVRRCGYACERVDESAVVGSIMDRIREGIEQAEFVVADLTEGRPNVYLEVGLAWGLGKRVLLLAREGEKLHFDLSHHKCIFYRTIKQLTTDLERSIRKLRPADPAIREEIDGDH